MVVGIEQVLVSRLGPEPHVVIPVILMRDLDHDALGMLARVEDLQPVWVVNAGFGRARAAPGGHGSRRGARRAVRRRASHHEDGQRHGRQRRKAGTQPNLERAMGPGPETITWAFASRAR